MGLFCEESVRKSSIFFWYWGLALGVIISLASLRSTSKQIRLKGNLHSQRPKLNQSISYNFLFSCLAACHETMYASVQITAIAWSKSWWKPTGTTRNLISCSNSKQGSTILSTMYVSNNRRSTPYTRIHTKYIPKNGSGLCYPIANISSV